MKQQEEAARQDMTPETGLSGRQWLMLLAVMTGTFLSMLNDFIVNVATPAIRDGLSASFAEVQLVIGGYVLVFGLVLVTGGRLGDIHGHKRMFLFGVGLFTLASLGCGLAPTPLALIVFRVAQALGAALFYPQVLSILQLGFAEGQRAKAFAAFDRAAGDVLESCEAEGLGFIPWFPLATGRLAGTGSILDEAARRHGITPSQLALAWLLHRSPVMLPIPGTSRVEHLRENVQAALIELSHDEFAALG